MLDFFDSRYPTHHDLSEQARQRIPKFVYEYIISGCHDDVCLRRNRSDMENVQLSGQLLSPFGTTDLSIDLFGQNYALPFGVAPVGLQGLMWPQMPEILAKAAAQKKIPFILSTMSSASLETIADASEGHAWFQLYNPTEPDIRSDMISRLRAAQYSVLVVTVDVPTFGYRPRDVRNHLAMPPKMTLSNICDMLKRPHWLLQTTLSGKPEMKNLSRYLPASERNSELADFINRVAMGPVDLQGLRPLRDMWHGKLVIKGITQAADVEACLQLGADAVIISNHGGRQLDPGPSSITALRQIAPQYRGKIPLFLDSGVTSGVDIARAYACGADYVFLGRSFVFGVAALGPRGAYHTINMLTKQLDQTLHQLRCPRPDLLPLHLVDR